MTGHLPIVPNICSTYVSIKPTIEKSLINEVIIKNFFVLPSLWSDDMDIETIVFEIVTLQVLPKKNLFILTS